MRFLSLGIVILLCFAQFSCQSIQNRNSGIQSTQLQNDLSLDTAQTNCTSTHDKVGHVTTLQGFNKKISGEVYIIDDCTIRIEKFTYNGNGIEVYLKAGKNFTANEQEKRKIYFKTLEDEIEKSNDANYKKVIKNDLIREENITLNFKKGKILSKNIVQEKFNNDTVTIRLPNGVSLDNLDGISIYDEPFVLSLSEGTFHQPKNNDLSIHLSQSNCTSNHQKVGAVAQLKNALINYHKVSGTAYIVDDCTIRIDGFTYDGFGAPYIHIKSGKNYSKTKQEKRETYFIELENEIKNTNNSQQKKVLNDSLELEKSLTLNFQKGIILSQNIFGKPFKNKTIVLRLPQSVTLDEVDGISVFDQHFAISFGSGTFQLLEKK